MRGAVVRGVVLRDVVLRGVVFCGVVLRCLVVVFGAAVCLGCEVLPVFAVMLACVGD